MGHRIIYNTPAAKFFSYVHVSFIFLLWSYLVVIVHAQAASISTNMPVPPLQWLNITGLTSGFAIPPLKDCSMGYDEATRSLIIFGGQSQANLPQQTTYILNMDTLTWSIPTTKVAGMTDNPSPRSRALGTGDFAVNSRREFVIFGGMEASGKAMNDVWAYDFMNEFWVQLNTSGGGPSPRWGASGGIDPTDTPNSGNDVSNGFNIAGGSDLESNFPLSEVWELNITGTLASDLNTLQGVWRNLSLSSRIPGKSDAGGTLVPKTQARPARIAISGGCGQTSSPLFSNLTCVDPNTIVVTVNPSSSTSIPPCPAPRLGPVMVPNLSSASSLFASQAFLLLGIFNSTDWNDQSGLSKGEVAVLDVDTGVWARLLPTGDPSSPNMFPEPRIGAASLAFNTALVGLDRSSASDTIIFGGQDSTGRYLNDIWILRAYNSTITHSGEKWPGFGDGEVQAGTTASGAGVTVSYLTQCAQNLVASSSSSTSVSGSPSGQNHQPNPTGVQTPQGTLRSEFDTSILHKTLSPISLAIAFVSIILIRLSFPAISANPSSMEHRLGTLYLGIIIGIIAYAVGIVGFVIALTSTKSITSSGGSFFRTSHGRAGLIFFLLFYAVTPLFFIFPWFRARISRGILYSNPHDSSQDSGAILGEKIGVNETQRVASPSQSAPEIHSLESSLPSRRQRTNSGPGLFPRWQDRNSSESSPPVTKGFEVVNRPRRSSTNNRSREIVRSLNELSWLERRRSVGVVADLDYALSHLGQTSPRSASPPPSSRPPTISMSNRPFVRTPIIPSVSDTPSSRHIILHAFFHILLLANCILALVMLFSGAPIVSFILFLIWTAFFYISLFYLAWNGRPRSSAITIAFHRLRGQPRLSVDPTPDETPVDDRAETQMFPHNGNSPYTYHQPPWRRAVSPDDDLLTRTSHGRPTAETDVDDDDDDEDEPSRQRRMEEELERRDVHIVTVPRKRLWITNPS